MRTLGSVGVGFALFSFHLAAQAPAPVPGSALPGMTLPGPPPPARPQGPSGPASDTAQAVTGTAKIFGRVVSAGTSVPLRRAQVRIVAPEQRVVKSATTDAEGRYEFTELPAGRYSVSVTRNGYVTLSFGQQRPFEPGKPLELADGQVAEKIDFALPRGGVISGRITDEVGEPLAGVGVRAMRYQYLPDGQRRLMPTGGAPYGFMTDDLGQFRVYGLMPGSYVVSASVNSMNGATVMPMAGGATVASFGRNDGSDGYAATYYPGTASEGEAQTVAVNIGQEAAVFFSMVPARLSNISGVVRNSQGRPAANVGIAVRSTQGIGMNVAFGGQTGPDGSFVMQNVPPGEYLLEVRPMGRPMPMMAGSAQQTDAEFASVPVAVSGQNISGLVITTGVGATVSGRVIFDTTNPPLGGAMAQAGQSTRVMFAAVDMAFGGMQGNAVIEPSGQFQITGLNGKGTFRVAGTASTVRSVMLHGVDITDTPLDVKPGSNIDGVEIALTNLQTSLTGTVRTQSGDPVKDFVVAIFPSRLRDGDVPIRFIRAVRPDQSGKFEAKGLPPADYFAAAVETMDQGEQWDPAFQDRVRARAKQFKLADGQSLALELQLIP
jgi:hypothetical protein